MKLLPEKCLPYIKLATPLLLLWLAGCDTNLTLSDGNSTTQLASAASQAKLPKQDSSQEYTSNASFAISSSTPSSTKADGAPSIDALKSSPSSSCSTLQVTTPRGLSCIQCTLSELENQRDAFIRILADTCLKNVSLSFLVDGSFGNDLSVISESSETLANLGRTPFIHIYLLNGPSQRRYRNTPVTGLFTQMSPERFRRLVQTDDNTRGKIVALVQDLTLTLDRVVAVGGVVSIVPMLEDNLDNDSFHSLAKLILDNLPTNLPISIGRNPCRGCYSGNENEIPVGFFAETHSLSRVKSITDGVFSNDGKSVALGGVAGISLPELAVSRDDAEQNNDLFLLWHASYQGLSISDNKIIGHAIKPTRRVYAVPSTSAQQQLSDFLRGAN